MKLSVVLITFNEEDRLFETLQSCADLADEILVVDAYSTDRTVEIARQFKATIHLHPFTDFGSQKNFALNLATHPWVLNLDADERVSEPLKQAILAIKQMPEEQIGVDGFLIKRKTCYLGRWILHSGWYPDRKLRLFKKEKSHWSGRIHESLVLDGNTGQLEGDILHFTYRDMNDHITRLNRYSKFQAQDIVVKGKKFLYLRALLLPPVTFLRFYLWKLGLLDGFPGLVIALVSSWATAMKYLKAIEQKRMNANPNPPAR